MLHVHIPIKLYLKFIFEYDVAPIFKALAFSSPCGSRGFHGFRPPCVGWRRDRNAGLRSGRSMCCMANIGSPYQGFHQWGYHPFSWDFPWNKASSYWGPPILGPPQICIGRNDVIFPIFLRDRGTIPVYMWWHAVIKFIHQPYQMIPSGNLT